MEKKEIKNLEVQFFGVLKEVTGQKSIFIKDIEASDDLVEFLISKFPGMKDQTYVLAVDNRFINGNTALKDKCVVACMPPFAGG